MALSRRDLDEILRYLRSRIRESPLRGIDDEVAPFATEGERGHSVFAYLDLLTQSARARGGIGLAGALRELNYYVKTESGEPIGSIEVVFDEDSARVFDTSRLVLHSDAALRTFLEEIANIREALIRDTDDGLAHQ